ncbi:MAG: SpoIID/LytB domain-containing protein [Nitrospirae bacterium]|nr:MAG: SpoIID/LytB domain-containing protein [Nitrospirota bacterium]
MRLVSVVCGMVGAVILAAPVQAADPIRVLLMQDVRQVVLSADRGLVVRSSGGEERLVASPLVVTVGSNGSGWGGVLVSGANGRTFTADSVTVKGQEEDLTVVADANSLVVGGTLQVMAKEKGLAVLNAVDLEEYVKGVVPSEMHSGWHPEALKVQAVVARTYVLYQRLAARSRGYDVVAGTQDQVYRGRHGLDQRVQQAVEATRGLVLAYGGAPILAAFSSTAAGPTEDAMNVWSKDLPYLKGVECPFDKNSPYYQWRAEFKLQDLESNLKRQGIAVGSIASLTPFAYSAAGRVAKLRLLHAQGELILRGEDLRRLVGYAVIPSTQFEVEAVGQTVVLTGRGAGHAVGLCQWGAKEMAGLGYPFATILRYYFPGTDLKDWDRIAAASSSMP